MKRVDITTKGWDDYQLIDSGDGCKLERFADVLLDRPDPQALWPKRDTTTWLDAQAQFLWADKGERWKVSTETPQLWQMSWGAMKLILSLKGFKHIGVFPEHAHQWEELQALGSKYSGLTMLNLFGYTGAASVAAALAGIKVTHVDASKSTIDTVKENGAQSGLAPDALRTVCEEALRYAKRLAARGEQFDIIIMDPPAFGRGPKGEVWKIEESLAELIALVPKLLTPKAKLVILNGYAAGYSARTFGELFCTIFPPASVTYGEVAIKHAQDERLLTTGIYAKYLG